MRKSAASKTWTSAGILDLCVFKQIRASPIFLIGVSYHSGLRRCRGCRLTLATVAISVCLWIERVEPSATQVFRVMSAASSEPASPSQEMEMS